MRKQITIGILAIVIVASGFAGNYVYRTYIDENKGHTCTNLFATVTFLNSSGFSTTVHPRAGTTEFVLSSNSSGHVTVLYSSNMSILTYAMLDGSVPVWPIDNTTGSVSFQLPSGMSMSADSMEGNGTHTVTVSYTVYAGKYEEPYLVGLPSTCYSVFINVGNTPYFGPLPLQQ
ncbi:MAG: hypothetical protein QXV32_05155 [Conexivisphaerales archaeon]